MNFLDQPQRVTHKPEANLPEIIEMDFPEGQLGNEFKKKFLYQDKSFE